MSVQILNLNAGVFGGKVPNAPNMAVRRRNLGSLFVRCRVCLSRHLSTNLTAAWLYALTPPLPEAQSQAAKHPKKPTRRLQNQEAIFCSH
jgi:hypothetical protein